MKFQLLNYFFCPTFHFHDAVNVLRTCDKSRLQENQYVCA